MAARAMWKGVIGVGDESVPVKLYAAVEDQGVHFRLLHARDAVPIKQHMVDPVRGKTVEPERVRKGLHLGGDEYVLLDDEELAELEPPASRDIDVLRFLPAGEIGHAWYDRPYFLAPDDDAEDAYFALAAAMRARDVEAVVRWVMRKKEYVGALLPSGQYLALMTLRPAGTVIPASALEPPAARKPTDREAALAHQLISALDTEFDPTEFRDEYRDRVLELVHAKATGGTVTPRVEEERPAPASLKRALEASVRTARKGRKVA